MTDDRPIKGRARLSPAGVELSITVPLTARSDRDADPPGQPPTGRRTHSPDFASVCWDGALYTFTPRQRSVVAALWQAREEGHHYLSQEALLEVADSDSHQLRDLFRGHPAWARVIVAGVNTGGRLGTYRLAQ